MPVTDDQMTALRTMLSGGELDEYKRLHSQLDREQAATGYTALIIAAFYDAVERHFGRQTSKSKIIEFVGDVRSRLDDPDALDPELAERLIRAVYTNESLEDLDIHVRLGPYFVLLGGMIADEKLSDKELDEFLAGARKFADEILAAEGD